MGNSSCRYVVNAVGKGGETYLTHCKDKQALNKWIGDNQEKIIIDEIRIVDKKRHPIFKWFSNVLSNK
ncbi:hypothetical protein [Peribacillus sp. SCS-155]|uniref:hypothetical protein n=1 Tax=Peribacillus sedimenti TaxID=3115297 RepID=UPI003905DA29